MSKKKLEEVVYDSVLEGIYSAKLKPNEIITENALIKHFGYSKSPIREALTALCHEGVLNNIPRCGYQIIALTTEDIEQMLSYRQVLETGMLYQNISYVTESHLRHLEQLAELCNKVTENVIEHWVYNIDFHVTLISIGSNRYAASQLRRCMDTLRRAYAQFHWNKWNHYTIPSDMKYHQQIIQALREKDVDRAALCLKNDLSDFEISKL